MNQKTLRRVRLGLRPGALVFALTVAVCFGGTGSGRVAAADGGADLPRVFLANPNALLAARRSLAAGDPNLRPALRRLRAEAQRALRTRPPSVMDKPGLPPSGDKHDFVSQAPYFWPDTNSPGRYIHRDGWRNPASGRNSDAGNFEGVCADANTLALAFYFTGDERYAAKSSEFLRVWFLNPATRMNPNLNFGQGIPGLETGRPEGIIAARGLVNVVDAVGLLAGAKSWTAADGQGMRRWMTQYLHWLTTSRLGRREAAALNNHGTFCDTQIAALALFTGQPALARKVLEQARQKRIARQIEPDGRQPLELRRTLSFNYSLFNLRALLNLASIGQNAGVDLWHYQTTDGRGILKALEFMARYANPNRRWPYPQIRRPDRGALGALLLRAAPHYPESGLANALTNFPAAALAGDTDRLCFKTAPVAGDESWRPRPGRSAE